MSDRKLKAEIIKIEHEELVRKVSELYKAGKTCSEIASELKIKESSVRNFLASKS